MARRACVPMCLLALAVVPALAQMAPPGPVFGPETYERTTGQTNTYHEQFPAPAGGYTLVVLNGDEEESRVSSATIVLDGQTVLTQSELNQNVDKVVKPVALRASNVMDITIGGAPGSYITVIIGAAQHCHGTAGRVVLPWGEIGGGPNAGADLTLMLKNQSPMGPRKVRLVLFNPDGTVNAVAPPFVLAPHASMKIDLEAFPPAANWAAGSIEIFWAGPRAGRITGYASVKDGVTGESQMAPVLWGGERHHHP